MLKLITIAACVLAVTAGMAWAGDMTSPHGKMTSEQMQAMKASMMKCSVCKHMAVHMDELGPVMTMEVAKLNDGMAMMHNITDPAKIAVFRAAGKETSAAGMACMAMTDEQAKAELCEFCQEIRSVVKSGATMSMGDTKMGDIMVFTSSDPTVQAKIAALGTKCEMMAGAM